MHDAHAFLQNLALVLCIAALTTVVFHRLRQPVVFGYLLAGMIVGPHLPLPVVADESTVRELSELGVILLMFSLGLEFSLRRVVRVAGTSGLAALAETSVMLGLGFMTARLLGWTPIESAFTGAMVAISSTTIVAKAFAERGVQGRVTEVVFGILIVEDLIAILLVAVLTALATGGQLSASGLAMTSIRLATFLVALIGVGILIVPRLVRAVTRAQRPEMTLVASIGICFAAALIALAFGYSVALGAFIAGSLVSESGEGKAIETLVQPVRDLFLAIFFVSVGMLIDPHVLVEHWGAVLALTVVVLVGKVVAVTGGAFLTGNGLRPSVQAGMSLAQIGEFSFIIAAVGTAAGAIRLELYPIAIAVSALTTFTTPWLIRAADPVALIVDRKLPRSVQTFVALYGSWIERLRATSPAAGGRARIRRLVRLLVIDVVLLAMVIIAAAAEVERSTVLLGRWLGLSERLAQIVVIGVSMVIGTPLVAGLVRTSWLLGLALAVRALPVTDAAGVDFARAPRAALVTTLQIAILLAIVAPLTAVTEPFLRGAPTIGVLLLVAVMFAIAFLRAARDLHGHARAGAHAIVAALSKQMTTTTTDSEPQSDELSRTMEHMNASLPGLGEPTVVVLPATSPVVGRSLAELDLRGLTGATILCITRSTGEERETLVPAGRERLRAGDVLAIAGPHDSVVAARVILLR
ncbi:MAG TPA: cation:proton antiporter [Gemmatimonadaceae bacterium]